MIVDIVIELKDGKAMFFLHLPAKNIYQFDDLLPDLYETPIYECDDPIIDLNILEKKIKNKLNEINKVYGTNFNDYDLILSENYSINNKNIYNFIKMNENLNIVLRIKDLNNVIKVFGNKNIENLKISFKNSEEYIQYNEFYKMHQKLEEIKKFVEYYNLSPLEQILLVYDIVKANEYTEVDLDQNFNVSRDLNQIIKGDKIVCVGFSNLIDFLLTNLGFKTDFIITEYIDEKNGHIRNYLHLVDKKYNIDGIFALDSTWDSKKNDNYLDNYSFFLKPIKYFFNYKKTESITKPHFFEMLKLKKEEFINKMLDLYKDSKFEAALIISSLVGKYSKEFTFPITFLVKSNEEINNILEEIYVKYHQKINRITFKNALYKVRRIEFLNKIIDFEPNEQYIDSVSDKYYKLTPEEKLLYALFMKNDLDKDLKDLKAVSVEQDLLRIRLLKAFKTKLNDFPDNDYIKKM